jgi:hypothetical protein
MTRYTFRLGDRQETGLEFLFRVDGPTIAEAIKLGDQLLNPNRKGWMGEIRRRWDTLRNTEMLSEDGLVAVAVLPRAKPVQLKLDLVPYVPEMSLFPHITGYVELPTAA